MDVDNDVVLAARLAPIHWRGPGGISALQGPQVGAVDGGAGQVQLGPRSPVMPSS